MKIKYFMILFLVLTSAVEAMVSRSEMVGRILNQFADEQLKKNNLTVFGQGSSIPDNIRCFYITFTSSQKMDIDQARKLFVELAQNLIDRINKDELIRPYLQTFPANINSIRLGLDLPRINDPQKKYVSFVVCVNGNLDFSAHDPITRILKTVHEEPYADAVKIVTSSK